MLKIRVSMFPSFSMRWTVRRLALCTSHAVCTEYKDYFEEESSCFNSLSTSSKACYAQRSLCEEASVSQVSQQRGVSNLLQ